MDKIFFLFFGLPILSLSQELTLYKATVQTINYATMPTTSISYFIFLKKDKPFKWSVDSIYSIKDNKKVNFNIVKVADPDIISPDYKPLSKFEKNYIGMVQLTFANFKSLDQRDIKDSQKSEYRKTNDFSEGVIVYYRANRNKKKKLKILHFDQLETIESR